MNFIWKNKIENKNKLKINKFINKTQKDKNKYNEINKIKIYNNDILFNSYTFIYNKRKNENKKYIFNNNNYTKNLKNSHDNNEKKIIKNRNNNYILMNLKNNTDNLSLNKYINKKNLKIFERNSNINNILLKVPLGSFSYKKSNNIIISNVNQKVSPIKNTNFAQKFINTDNKQKTIIEENNDHKSLNNINNSQIENISNINQKLNNSIHHINSSSSLNTIENFNNNYEINNNNINNLMLKNKITNNNKMLFYGDEEQDNKNICINKSTKSTKSRSVDLNKYLIKPLNDTIKINNINLNKDNSLSSINKKNNEMEIDNYEDDLSNQESLQLSKLKSNEFEDNYNYNNIKNTNNENNINNYINENNNKISEDTKKYNKENRRLLIEYLKIIKKKYRNFNIEELCKINNINQNILNLSSNQYNFTLRKNVLNIGYLEHNNLFNYNYNKIDYLNFLSTPRIMFLINDINEKIPYIFSLSPNISSYNNGIERYSFKWINIKNFSDNTSYDLYHLKKCNLNQNNNKIFYIIFEEHDYIEENENYSSTFNIDALSFELANNYVNGLNYLNIQKNDFK